MDAENYDIKSISKKFGIVKLISRGGFGTVYEAVNLANSRRCALKTINILRYKNSSFDLFLNEGRILKNVTPNRHIIKLYSEQVFGTTRALELELLECSLQELIVSKMKANATFSEAETITIIRSLLTGLQHLHTQDIVHRDIKPENLGFMNSSKLDTLKIIDFGLSAQLALEDNRMMHMVVGTVAYMAPEMFSMNEYNSVF